MLAEFPEQAQGRFEARCQEVWLSGDNVVFVLKNSVRNERSHSCRKPGGQLAG